MKKIGPNYPKYETTEFTDFRDMVDHVAQNKPEGIAFSYKNKPNDSDVQNVTYEEVRKNIHRVHEHHRKGSEEACSEA